MRIFAYLCGMEMYADVILPVPLNAAFTYAVPQALVADVRVGSRVLVQFGARHFYTGIVETLHAEPPQTPDVKEIAQLLDAEPVVRRPQLQLWHWLADYYLCGIGDVMKAALPAGLKVESETAVELSPDVPADALGTLTGPEEELVALLRANGRMTAAEIRATAPCASSSWNTCFRPAMPAPWPPLSPA